MEVPTLFFFFKPCFLFNIPVAIKGRSWSKSFEVSHQLTLQDQVHKQNQISCSIHVVNPMFPKPKSLIPKNLKT